MAVQGEEWESEGEQVWEKFRGQKTKDSVNMQDLSTTLTKVSQDLRMRLNTAGITNTKRTYTYIQTHRQISWGSWELPDSSGKMTKNEAAVVCNFFVLLSPTPFLPPSPFSLTNNVRISFLVIIIRCDVPVFSNVPPFVSCYGSIVIFLEFLFFLIFLFISNQLAHFLSSQMSLFANHFLTASRSKTEEGSETIY